MSTDIRNWKYCNITGQELERDETVVAQTFDRVTGDVHYKRVEVALYGGVTDLRWQEVRVDETGDEAPLGIMGRIRRLLPL